MLAPCWLGNLRDAQRELVPRFLSRGRGAIGGSVAEKSIGRRQTRTDFGAPGYGGPCPPPGHGPHRYVFTVFAVKEETLPVNADTSAAIVGFQLHFNTLAKAALTGKFERK